MIFHRWQFAGGLASMILVIFGTIAGTNLPEWIIVLVIVIDSLLIAYSFEPEKKKVKA